MTSQNNSLEHAASSYLRSAMHQPVQWHEWSDEAFALAAREDKPVLLDIGAVWCHWCHVMDRESYEDATLARLINEHFIAVKVDRDERPDIDSRYQAAVQSISGQGGWPLTAVLTPDGKPFFGGTYFPREDRYGRPGFDRVLLTLADVWKNRREEALESAESVLAAIEHSESFAGRSGSLSSGIVDRIVASAVQQFDPRHGGFGTQPKFPHPAALDLLLDVAARTGDQQAREAALVTLRKMAAGGVYDQLAGGFHRYSVDERWVVPHFEKMLYDNAGLLANYVHAFQSFVEPEFARVARDIIRWMDEWLTDREHGGFYASQDADLSLDDDGDYFTWTQEEAAAVLTAEELQIAGLYYDLGELGDMHHNPKKNVLFRQFTVEQVAERIRKTPEQTQALLLRAAEKLYGARLQRATPFIDRTLYSGWNALAISAYLEAARVLDLPKVRDFALLTLDRVLREAWAPSRGLAHVAAYPEVARNASRVPGTLDDYAFLLQACLDAWQSTARLGYYESAVQLAEGMIARFYDATGGGFFDCESTGPRTGALVTRRKPLQDSPTPAGNAVAAAALLQLEQLSGRSEFREKAEDTLESFAGIVEHFGLYAASYALALQRFLLPHTQVAVIGEGTAARQLQAIATARFGVDKSVVLLAPQEVRTGQLPPALAETLPGVHLPSSGSIAVVCRGFSCLPPTADGEELLRQISAANEQ